MQCQDGTQHVGTPVTVTNGIAVLPIPLAVSNHSLSAVFRPTDSVAVGPSTTLTVNPH